MRQGVRGCEGRLLPEVYGANSNVLRVRVILTDELRLNDCRGREFGSHQMERKISAISSGFGRLPYCDERYLLKSWEVIFFIGLAFGGNDLLDGSLSGKNRTKILSVNFVVSRQL
jgi:hypothetical protein